MKVLANDGISPAGIKAFEKYGFEMVAQTVAQEQLPQFILDNNIEVLLVRSATKVRQTMIDQVKGTLKVVGRGGVGLDNIDVDYAKSNDIQVINTPAASSKSVAELVFAHFLGMVRHLHDSNRKMPLEGDSQFKQLKKVYEDANEMAGKTLGVVGLGRIGIETIKIGIGLGMNVIAYDKFIPTKDIQLNFFDGQSLTFHIKSVDSLETIYKQSDFISFHVPAQDGYLVGEAEFKMMKNGAMIVNAARGGVIDEKALVKALDAGEIAGAGLDVFENEPAPEIALLMHGKLSLTPHIGGSTNEAQERIGEELADQVAEIFGKK